MIISSVLCVVASAASDYQTFTPYHGNAFIREYNSIKYATVRVKWNASGITEFNASNDTFEKDLVFYNYDGEAYATGCSSYESELPNTYWDTQFLDGNNELRCSVGTFSADEIVANSMYYTYMMLADENNSNSSMYKVQLQEGYYIFQSTWAVVAQTTNTLIPFKSGFMAPESRTWSYETENNNTQATARDTGIGYWNSGTMSTEDDIDYWKLSGAGRKNFRLICPSGLDYDMRIYNSSGTIIAYSYSTSDDHSTTITLPSGTYYIKIYSINQSSTTENYRLIITNQ